jgi:hypothetical protein
MERSLEMNQMSDVSGTAALAVGEGLLLALHDNKTLPEREILGSLEHAGAAHQNPCWCTEAGTARFGISS